MVIGMISSEFLRDLNLLLGQVLQSLMYFFPELCLLGLLIGLVVMSLFPRLNYRAFWYLSVGGMLLLLPFYWGQGQFVFPRDIALYLFNDTLALSPFILGGKLIIWLATFFTLLLSVPAYNFPSLARRPAEYFIFLMGACLGLHLMLMASDMITLYMSIETVSICSYFLCGYYFKKTSSEASLKYLIYGAFSSAVMLYGMSWLYGMSGSTQHLGPANFWPELLAMEHPMVFLAWLMALSGLLFKLASVPFQFWAPDVYEASPTAVAAFFSVAPKAAAVLALYRWGLALPEASFVLGPYAITWGHVIAVLALLSMFVGNLSALGQRQAKRLMAYSSIAHVGFLMIPLLAPGAWGMTSLLFYLFIYISMNFSAFLLIDRLAMEGKTERSFLISSWSGRGMNLPLWGVGTVLVMIALTGLPPTAGFTAKLLVFSGLWEFYQASPDPLFLFLFILGILNAALSLFYYLKIPYYLFMVSGSEEDTSESLWQREGMGLVRIYTGALFAVLLFPLVLFFFKSDWLWASIQYFCQS